MHNDNIIDEKEATEGMIRGVNRIISLIKPTYGGHGVNVTVESTLRPYNIVANDAWTIIQPLVFAGTAEKRALAFIKELCERADKSAGDARKTTILICSEILNEGYKANIGKLELKKELDSLIPFIENEISKNQTTHITVDAVGSVATTASENADTGKLLQEIYQKIGKDGIIDVEGSGTYETSYTLTEGVKFDMAGLLSASLVHDEQALKDKLKETCAIYYNPTILVTKKKITADDDINPILAMLENEGKKDLVIFTNDMDSGVANMLIALHKGKRFNICIIKAPSLWQDFYFEDFAKCTGATIVEDATGLNLRKLPFEVLGTCDKIIVETDDHNEGETRIIGTKDISDHIAKLQARGDDDSKLRLSWLNKNTAKIKLGSNSMTDLAYKRLKCNDAVRSSQAALQYGIVKGGGQCLNDISELLPDTVAGNVLRKALAFPYQVNMENAKGDLVPENIVDASRVVALAVRNAIGIASTMLTQGGIVYIPEKTPQQISYEIAMNKQYDF